MSIPTETKEQTALSLPTEVLESIFKMVIFNKSNKNTEEQMKQYRNVKLVCTKFNDILNHPDFLSRSTKRRWSLISSKYMRHYKLIQNLNSITTLGQQCIKEGIKELVKNLSNYSNSHVQSASTLLFSASRGPFSSLTNRNKINSAVSDFRNIVQQISGDDEAGLIKHVLKRDPALCKSVFDEHLLKFITNTINPSEYLDKAVLTMVSGRRNNASSAQANVSRQSIDKTLWSINEAEHMFIHLGGGMSEQDYDGLEHSLRAVNGRNQIPKLSALKKNLERFKELVTPTVPNETKGFRVINIVSLLLEHIMEISSDNKLDLEKLPPEEIKIIVGEGGDTFSDSKGLKQSYKVFAVSFAVRIILHNDKEIWRDLNAQSDESRVPIAVINASENAELLKRDLSPVVTVMEEIASNGLNQMQIVRKLEGDLKYKKLCLNRSGQHYFCDFCKVSLDNVQNLSHEWNLETTIDDLNGWAAESQFGQTGPPNIPFDPKTQVTIDSLHAKLRIVGKLIEQLTDEAALLDHEMVVASMSLKLAENDLHLFEKYTAEINEHASERLKSFEKSCSELLAKAAEEDTISILDRKLVAANKHLLFDIPCYSPPPAYDSSNDVNNFIESSSNQPKPYQCSLCNKLYASKDSIVRHLRVVHGKTKEPSEKEKKELIKIAKENLKSKKIELLQQIELFLQSNDTDESQLFQNSQNIFKKRESFNVSSLKNEFDTIDELINKQGNLADCKCRINCNKANFEKELRGQKCRMFRGKISEHCRYDPPKKDANGNVTETRTEAINRIEKIKKRKHLKIMLNLLIHKLPRMVLK